MDKQDLAKAVNDASRKITVRGSEAIIPEKFDKDGDLVDEGTPAEKYVLHRCPLDHLKFLKLWQESDYLEDPAKMAEKAGLSIDRAEFLIKKLTWLKTEDSRIRALANIITPEKILVRHWENSYTNELDDGQRDSLKETAKIVGAYKNNLTVSVTQNVFNLPHYDPATEAKLKAIADQEAMVIQDAQVVNG